ncbi:hypothetical protein C8R43DRAFT_445453 [Mycena crocata]|nr:hypothetical protein C8R43DRAFT_445453 [Mycena crocata]
MPLSLVPAPAAFVVFTIDPVATVAALNDPVATAAARKMTMRKYVGYVSKTINCFNWDAPYHTYSIQLISPTIPEPCLDDGITKEMYTPILPVTTHPLGRAPLRPKQALPWATSYQPSFMRTVVRVPVKVGDDADAVFLDSSDVIRHRRLLALEDAQRQDLLRSSSCAASTSRSGYVNFSDLDEYTGDLVSLIDVEGAYEDRYYADTVEASRPPDTMIVVSTSYNLSKVEDLMNPIEFFEEKRRLKQLEAESKARKAGQMLISTPASELENIPENIHHSVREETQQPRNPEPSWSLWERRKLQELLSSIRIPASVIREVATRSRRLSVFIGRKREEGLNFIQGWTSIRFL